MLQVISRFCFLVALMAWTSGVVLAVQPDEILKDATLEHRARDISAGLRCLVCQNQSIDDSDAPLAKDLRLLVRERLTAGDTNEQVVDYVVARYGEFVLLKPPFNSTTLLLWISPLVVLLFGIWLGQKTLRSRRAAEVSEAPLSADEKARLEALLKGDDKA